jgi:hypothetical protein
LSVTIDNIDTRLIPFSRRYTRLMLLTGPERRTETDWRSDEYLWLSYTGLTDRYDLVKLQPTRGGAPVEYKQTATPGKLTLRDGAGGTLEFVYGDGETLLVRGRGG